MDKKDIFCYNGQEIKQGRIEAAKCGFAVVK